MTRRNERVCIVGSRTLTALPDERVCIVGSRTLTALPDSLFDVLASLSNDTTVLLRHPRDGEAGLFERMVARACERLWLSYAYIRPGGGGRKATYERDINMVGMSSRVLAYFDGEEMSGGTEHVVDKAIDQRVPVDAYGLRDGVLVLLGSYSPE